MSLRNRTTILALVFYTLTLSGQDTWYGTMSGMHFMYNPAYTGSSGLPVMNISCYSFLPGNNFALRSGYASFDTYLPGLHGGTGLWLSDDMLGEIINDFRAGASYAYHLQAGRDLFFNAGLTASVVHRGIKTGAVILPGDIDPFNGFQGTHSEYITDGAVTAFDIGTGITFAKGPWYGGVSVMHLTQPWLSESRQNNDRIRRLYTVSAGTSFSNRKGEFSLSPSVTLLAQADNVIIYLGTEALYRSLMGGVGFWHAASGFTAAEPSLGWDAGSAKIILSYSYVLAGGDTAIKGTAIVKAGLTICFNNVEKSRAIHIIKLPDL
jgi:type IX secretion system PorP/SprF family membrane protein